MLPEVALEMPVMIFISVVFPAPFGPSIVTMPGVSSVRLTSLTATMRPKVLVRLRISTEGGN
jgi:hypothetical protein